MAQQRGSQNRKLLVGLQTAEAFFGFQHCGSGPSQRHPCITPTFDVAADLPQHGHQALDRVGAAKRAPKFRRQTQTDHGEHFVQTFEDRLLVVMLESDELTAGVQAAERDLADTRKASSAAIEALDGEKTALEERIARAARDRDALVRELPAQAVALFDSVRNRRQTAVVEARDGHCTVCHVRLRPQVFNIVRANEQIVQCDSCQRILYYVPTPPKTADSPPAPQA